MGYVLFDEIAAGGMATVHFGRLTSVGGFSRTVAIKRLHAHLAKDPEFVSMFLDEARLAARIRHPNVAQTLDVVANGEVLIVMEYIPGESLSRVLRAVERAGEQVPIAYALALIAGVLQGLHAAHEATDEAGRCLEIVHRDVSPQNILVGTDGIARVLDFGVAKATGRLQNTQDGSLKGKIAYMAPEQLFGQELTRQSDIYSACVVLWEMLAGRRLFQAPTDAALVNRITSSRIEPPSVFNPGVPGMVDDLVTAGLSRRPASRPATARELAVALERSGGLVAASEIGEWLQRLVSPALQTRAKMIADIERASASDFLVQAGAVVGAVSSSQAARAAAPYQTPAYGESPRAAGPHEETVTTRSNGGHAQEQRSLGAPASNTEITAMVMHDELILSTTRSPPEDTRPRKKWGVVVASVLLSACVGIGAAIVAVGAGHNDAAPAASVAPAPAAASAPTNPPSATATAAPAPLPLPLAEASPKTPSAPATAAQAAPPQRTGGMATVAVAQRGKAAATAKPPPPSADCEVPFVIDEAGRKIYKRQCLGQ